MRPLASTSSISAFSVVAMRETPGIGDKILVDKDFLAYFALEAKFSTDLKALANAAKEALVAAVVIGAADGSLLG